MLVRPFTIIKNICDTSELMTDILAEEAPLEIRLIYGKESNRIEKPLSVTMRTPGDDAALAMGFIISEGFIKDRNDILAWKHCEQVPKEATGNVFKIWMNPDWEFPLLSLDRNFYTTSSCGICGKSSIEAIKTQCSIIKKPLSFDPKVIATLPEKLKEHQIAFKYSGGIHASALFSAGGEFVLLKEDVGRHNALDKIIGHQFLMNLFPVEDYILLVSGRLSFELVQKAGMAGISVIAAIGAPSSLAVQLAEELKITLFGFVKHDRWNQYTLIQ
jgi:FdhD protein